MVEGDWEVLRAGVKAAEYYYEVVTEDRKLASPYAFSLREEAREHKRMLEKENQGVKYKILQYGPSKTIR